MTASIISRVIDAAAAGAGAGCLESRVWRVTTSGAGCVGAAVGSRRVLGWGTLNTGTILLLLGALNTCKGQQLRINKDRDQRIM